MKYSPRQYAAALRAALEEKSGHERKEILKNFVRALARARTLAKLPVILREVEKQALAAEGLKKVEVESASPVDEKTRKEIERRLGHKIFLKEKINPELLAGIRILVDDETLIDASAKRQLEKMFAKNTNSQMLHESTNHELW